MKLSFDYNIRPSYMTLNQFICHIYLEQETGVVVVEEERKPEERVESAFTCLVHYDPSSSWSAVSTTSFRYWKIRDYAYAYRSRIATPSMVSP